MTWTFSDEVIEKAKRYLAENRVAIDPEQDTVFWVTGTTQHQRAYRVQTDADPKTRKVTWIACTCPHGQNVGAGTAKCSHVVAVLMLIRDRKKETVE